MSCQRTQARARCLIFLRRVQVQAASRHARTDPLRNPMRGQRGVSIYKIYRSTVQGWGPPNPVQAAARHLALVLDRSWGCGADAGPGSRLWPAPRAIAQPLSRCPARGRERESAQGGCKGRKRGGEGAVDAARWGRGMGGPPATAAAAPTCGGWGWGWGWGGGRARGRARAPAPVKAPVKALAPAMASPASPGSPVWEAPPQPQARARRQRRRPRREGTHSRSWPARVGAGGRAGTSAAASVQHPAATRRSALPRSCPPRAAAGPHSQPAAAWRGPTHRLDAPHHRALAFQRQADLSGAARRSACPAEMHEGPGRSGGEVARKENIMQAREPPRLQLPGCAQHQGSDELLDRRHLSNQTACRAVAGSDGPALCSIAKEPPS